MTIAVTFAAFFSFGYCITDMVTSYLSDRRLNKLLKSTVENYDD